MRKVNKIETKSENFKVEIYVASSSCTFSISKTSTLEEGRKHYKTSPLLIKSNVASSVFGSAPSMNMLSELVSNVFELRSVFVDPLKDMESSQSKTTKEKIQAGFQGVKNNSRRLVKFVKSKIRRKEKETIVQDIQITPEDDDETWARRSVGSAASRSSIESKLSSASSKKEDDNILSDMDCDDVEE
uniref:Uncharacterized protein n=1 Tax=Magallana gigas TaxID=29159 RepID=K1PP11_MAGGI